MTIKDLPKSEQKLTNTIIAGTLQFIMEKSIDEAIKLLDFSDIQLLENVAPLAVRRAVSLGLLDEEEMKCSHS